MKALLIADTHWLWYASGRWGAKHGFKRPRVDYMALRNVTAKMVLDRFGAVYELDCRAWVVTQRNSMDRFIDLLSGFGFRVTQCDDPTPLIVDVLKNEHWDLAILAHGSFESITATAAARQEGRKVIVAAFEPPVAMNGVPVIMLDRSVLYEA